MFNYFSFGYASSLFYNLIVILVCSGAQVRTASTYSTVLTSIPPCSWHFQSNSGTLGLLRFQTTSRVSFFCGFLPFLLVNWFEFLSHLYDFAESSKKISVHVSIFIFSTISPNYTCLCIRKYRFTKYFAIG